MADALHRVTKAYLSSINTPDYPSADWIIDPDLSAVAGFAPKYWIIVGDQVSLMAPAARAAVDAAEDAAVRDGVADDVDRVHPAIMRAFAEILVDELNEHSAKINAILDAAAAATSLATFKTTMLAIQDQPPRTLSQLKTAIRNKLDG